MLDSTVIDHAVSGQYTEFSGDIKSELQAKMSNHPVMSAYAKEYDRIQKVKQMFAQINGQSEE